VNTHIGNSGSNVSMINTVDSANNYAASELETSRIDIKISGCRGGDRHSK